MTATGSGLATDAPCEVCLDGMGVEAGVDLFNLQAFHLLHRLRALGGTYLVRRHRGTGSASMAVHFLEGEQGHFMSPWRGSFGGFQLVDGTVPRLDEMDAFVECSERLLRDLGARRVTVVLPPLAYHVHETSAWVNVLLRAGYAVVRHELNYAIDVGRPFEDGIDRGNRKQLRKAERAGLAVADLAQDEYDAAYAVIVENRAKKGRTPSMSWEELHAMASAFPDAVRCFGVRDGTRLIAAAICLRVNPHALYVFYWGEVAGAEALSPVTLVARHAYEWCIAAGVSLLDLGTATVDGVPDPGLVSYKRHLGGRESLKLTLAKDVR